MFKNEVFIHVCAGGANPLKESIRKMSAIQKSHDSVYLSGTFYDFVRETAN